MNRPAHAGLRHLALNVQNLEAMKRFYVDVLGFSVEWEPDADNVYLSSGIDNLALHRAAAGHTGPPLRQAGNPAGSRRGAEMRVVPGALDHLGLIVRRAEEVDEWAAFLESQAIALKAKPKTHRDGARSLYFHDPDGNSIQIIYHPPISGKT